jgi:hypothetical protein
VVEHRIARLVQLGIRQARYIGRTKTLFQLLMAAAVANLTLLANTATEASADAIIAGACCALLAVLPTRQRHPNSPQGPYPTGWWPAPRATAPALLPASSWPNTLKMATSRPGF